MWKHFRYGIVFAVLIMATVDAQGQQGVLRLTPYNGQASSFINEQIKADTTTNHGIPAGRIYELQRGGTYLATATFNVTTGKTLSLRANDSTGRRPVIMLYPTGSGTTPARPPGYLFQLGGGNLYMKNIMVTGYFEPIDTNFNNVQGGIINTNATGSSIVIDSCLFTQIAGQHIRTGNATVKVQVTNTVFADMGALSTSNLGAGKGFDLREASCDSLILVNNTFVNFQDRVVRHYNFANPGAGTAGIKYFLFDHNTIVNGMSYHGLLSLGNLGGRAYITNNLFLDAFACGEDSGDASRQAEWANTGEKYPNGSNRTTWIFTAPDQTTVWRISNNYYAISDSGLAFLNRYAPPAADVLGEGSPLSWHINGKLGADSVNAFKKISSLKLGNIPALMTKLMRWYRSPDGGNLTKNTPSSLWVRSRDDMDRRKYQYYDDTLDCSYATTVLAYSGGTGGYPVGDLNWFPTRKAAWMLNPPSAVEAVDAVPATFALSQNYPNPFNPSTTFQFAITKSSHVVLEVFNVLGQPVATLVDESLTPGTYKMKFDASALSSGVYLYRLTAGDFTQTMKMVLMK